MSYNRDSPAKGAGSVYSIHAKKNPSSGGTIMEILKVSAKSNPNSVAGALAGVMREKGGAEIQAIGAGALNQAHRSGLCTRIYRYSDRGRRTYRDQTDRGTTLKTNESSPQARRNESISPCSGRQKAGRSGRRSCLLFSKTGQFERFRLK